MKAQTKAAFLAVAAVLASAGAASAQQEQTCTPRIIAALDMQTIPDGRVTVPVQLEGRDYRFLVDTGGFINTVTPQLVQETGYHENVSRRMVLRGMGERTALNTFVRVDDFAIGQMHERYRPFFVDDFNDLSVDGTLVPSERAPYDVDFDFGHDRLNLLRRDRCVGAPASGVPMEIQSQTHIRVPVTIDGHQIMATFDTGATTSFVNRDAAARLLGIGEGKAGMTSLGNIAVNGTAGPVYNFPFQTLTFGNVTVTRPHIQIVSDPVWSGDELLLGIDILRQFHLTIAYGEKKLYIAPARAD